MDANENIREGEYIWSWITVNCRGHAWQERETPVRQREFSQKTTAHPTWQLVQLMFMFHRRLVQLLERSEKFHLVWIWKDVKKWFIPNYRAGTARPHHQRRQRRRRSSSLTKTDLDGSRCPQQFQQRLRADDNGDAKLNANYDVTLKVCSTRRS